MVAAWALGGVRSQASWPFSAGETEVHVALSSEAKLVRLASEGKRDAFASLVERHKRSVYGLCVRLLQDPEEARDAAQETFARACGALDGLDPESPFRPWVLRIARNLCLDLIRRRLPAKARLELDALPEEGASPELADPAAERGDEVVERAEVRASLSQAVAALPPHYREAVHLFHIDELSYKEIAATLGVPIGTVMTWLHRARSRLRQALEKEGEE